MDFFVCGAIVFAIYLINCYFLSYWTRRGFYQLQPKFLIGDIGSVLRMNESMGERLQKIYNKNKSQKVIGLYFSYRPTLMVNDPLLVQDILVRDFASFHDRGFHVDEVKDPLSGHLVSLSGQKWRDLRVKLSPTFTSSKLKGMFPIIRDCGKVLEDYLISNVKEGKIEIDCRDLFARYTTNIISSVAFGIDNDCINNPDDLFRRMGIKIMESTFKQAITDIIAVFMPGLLKFILIKTTEQDIEDFIFSIVNQTIEHREKNNFSRNDFMQLLIELKNQGYVSVDKDSYDDQDDSLTSKDIKKLTVSQIAAQVFIFFIAGFETSSSTMFFCLFELAKNPKVQQKVQQEIDEVFTASIRDNMTYETLSKLKYLECCIDEALRKYPIAPALIRECTTDYKIPGSDLVISKGTSIFIPTLGHHRDPEIFENPMEFKPERFLNSSTGDGKSSGLFYLPFGDGSRSCIGKRMGKAQTIVGLASVLSKFRFELSDKSMLDKEIEFDAKQFLLTPAKSHLFTIKSR